ncbi:MAG: hypothetical protein WC969_10075 [Elusimicrobiota bacterium]|jgi:hypothetical protein
MPGRALLLAAALAAVLSAFAAAEHPSFSSPEGAAGEGAPVLSSAAVAFAPVLPDDRGAAAVPPEPRIHLAFFTSPQPSMHLPSLGALERLLRERTTGYALVRSDTLLCHHNSGTYHFRLPAGPAPMGPAAGADATLSTAAVAVYETSDDLVAVLGEDSALAGTLETFIRDPLTYDPPSERVLERRRAELQMATMEGGERLLTLQLEPEGRAGSSQWRSSAVLLAVLRHEGRERTVAFIAKSIRGEGRVAAAVAELRRRHGDGVLVFSRYGAYPPSDGPDAAGTPERLERMGVSAVVPAEPDLRRIDEIEAFHSARPKGLRFLAANLVYSTAPERGPLPASAAYEREGARICVIGLTRAQWADALPARAAKALRIIDPLAAARREVARVREGCDLVVALTNLTLAENAGLTALPGVDLVLADPRYESSLGVPDVAEAIDSERSPWDPPLYAARAGAATLSHLALAYRRLGDRRRALRVREDYRPLDETLTDAPGYPEFDLGAFGITTDTGAALLPSVRSLYPEALGLPELRKRDFWTLAATLAAADAGAEAALLPVFPVMTVTAGDFTEAMVASWLERPDRLVALELPGDALSELVAQVRAQEAREKSHDAAPPELLRAALGGVEGGRIHGEPVDAGSSYRVVVTELLLSRQEQYPALKKARRPEPLGPLRETVLAALRRAAAGSWGPERYRALLAGRPPREDALWRVNFRDVSANLSNTKVVRDEAFNRVSNSRIQGYDEFLLGAALKVDAERRDESYRWGNTLEAEYARSRLRPPNQPPVVNVTTNRLLMRTVGTRSLLSFPWHWLAESLGPSVGLQYDGELEKTPGLRRKQVYSLFPGVEMFGGSWMKSVSLGANLKRDLSRDSANNQYGLRGRALLSHPLGAGTLTGELWSNYFVRTREDSDQDLLFEGDLNVKLRIPVFRQTWVAPFIDFYFFGLKTLPLKGYSAMTGVSIGFSRLWKPQYERF